jgi:hypothetical protein
MALEVGTSIKLSLTKSLRLPQPADRNESQQQDQKLSCWRWLPYYIAVTLRERILHQ